jgi:ArsR family metal-binding transcriptional regulator
VTRAVIKFTGDISSIIPVWAKAIPTAAFNKEIPILGFRYKNWRVIITAEEIMIKDLQTEAEAHEVIEYLKSIS